MDVERVLESGDDILILFRFRARGRDGLALDGRLGQVGRMHGGVVTGIVGEADWSSDAAAADLRLEDLA